MAAELYKRVFRGTLILQWKEYSMEMKPLVCQYPFIRYIFLLPASTWELLYATINRVFISNSNHEIIFPLNVDATLSTFLVFSLAFGTFKMYINFDLLLVAQDMFHGHCIQIIMQNIN